MWVIVAEFRGVYLGTNFSVPTINVVYGNHSTKQKTQELGCMRPWPTDHKVVPQIWSDLVFQRISPYGSMREV